MKHTRAITEQRANFVRLTGLGMVAVAGFAMMTSAASADEVADFYKGKTITLINGFPTGGPAQASVNVFIKHLANHIPGKPKIVSKNQPGAGTLRAANFVFNAADKDGTVIGLFSAGALLAPLWNAKGAKYDPRTAGWLGSPTRRPTAIAFFRKDAPAKSWVEAKKIEMTVGSTGAGASSSAYARMLNATAGTKFKLVLGYKGGRRLNLALEQNEIHGRLGYSWASLKRREKHLLGSGVIHVIAQLAVKPDPELKAMGVPMAIDDIKDPIDKRIARTIFGVEEMSRPYAVPAGVPAARLAALRKAVADTVADPAYVAEVKAKLPDPIALTTGAEITKFINDAYGMPENVLNRARSFMTGK